MVRLRLGVFARIVNRLSQQYWQATIHRESSRKKHWCPTPWTPPKLGHFKFNFDVSLVNNHVTSVVVLKNHLGVVTGVWIIHFCSCNSFCMEMEVAIQAFTIADDMRMQTTHFEGDVLQVILSLHGMEQFSD